METSTQPGEASCEGRKQLELAKDSKFEKHSNHATAQVDSSGRMDAAGCNDVGTQVCLRGQWCRKLARQDRMRTRLRDGLVVQEVVMIIRLVFSSLPSFE
jgi:hypothetical protein